MKIRQILFILFAVLSYSSSASDDWQLMGSPVQGSNFLDYFGWATAISGDGSTFVVGAYGTAEYVRVYKWHSSSWNQLGNNLQGEVSNTNFGGTVAINGDGTIVAAAAPLHNSYRGQVRIFKWNGSSWQLRGNPINGEHSDDRSGSSLSMSEDGNAIAIGAYYSDVGGQNSGQVKVYVWDGSDWAQRGGSFDGDARLDGMGTSVAINSDGSHVVVGAPNNNQYTGLVRVFRWDGSVWVQMGSDFLGRRNRAYMGQSVSISADGQTFALTDSEDPKVFSWDGSSWTQVGTVNGQGAKVSMSADGNSIAVGHKSWSGQMGRAVIYKWTGSVWNQVGTPIVGMNRGKGWAEYVSLSSDGSRIAIGAQTNADNGSGTVHVYELPTPTSQCHGQTETSNPTQYPTMEPTQTPSAAPTDTPSTAPTTDTPSTAPTQADFLLKIEGLHGSPGDALSDAAKTQKRVVVDHVNYVLNRIKDAENR